MSGEQGVRLEAAIAVALRAHSGQMDRRGEPYVRHALRVMEAVCEEARVVAVLHDVLEDAGGEHLDAIRHRLHEEELDALELLARRGSEEYSTYIARLIAGGNRLAMLVKRADLVDNLRPCENCPAELRERYHRALELVEDELAVDVVATGAEDVTSAVAEEERVGPGPGMAEITIDPDALYDSLETAILLGYGGSDKNRRSRVSAIPEAELTRTSTGPRGGIIRFRGSDIIGYLRLRERRRADPRGWIRRQVRKAAGPRPRGGSAEDEAWLGRVEEAYAERINAELEGADVGGVHTSAEPGR